MTNNTTPGRRLVDLETFSAQYGITTRTARQWISEGKVTAYRLGARLIRIDLDEAEEMLLTPIPTGWNSAA